jgi:methionine-rich copper-binding protein CopC
MSGAVILGRKARQTMAGKSRGIDVLSHVKAWRIIVVALCLFFAILAGAQTPAAVATYPRAALDFTGIVAKTQTTPLDDSVFDSSPERLALSFPEKVHLVKLILRDQAHDWVDISFRYSPRLASDFEWSLPSLQTADYYTAEWAILDEQDRLIRGSFSFSFGEMARMPSLIKAEQELALRLRNGEDESTRFITPPRTEIILEQEPRSYDPPFTLRLESRESNEIRKEDC